MSLKACLGAHTFDIKGLLNDLDKVLLSRP